MLSERNARPPSHEYPPTPAFCPSATPPRPPIHNPPPPPPPNLTMRSSARKAVPLAGAALAPNPYPSCLHR